MMTVCPVLNPDLVKNAILAMFTNASISVNCTGMLYAKFCVKGYVFDLL